MDRGLSPTHWQKSTVPAAYRDRIDVIFDGVDTQTVKPDLEATLTVRGRVIRAGDKVITFINRNLEPHRGYLFGRVYGGPVPPCGCTRRAALKKKGRVIYPPPSLLPAECARRTPRTG
jgi:hypothetical protein